MDNIIINTQIDDEDRCFDASLRPTSFSEYIGQDKIKENLQVLLRRRRDGVRPLIMCYFLDLLALARRLSPILLPKN